MATHINNAFFFLTLGVPLKLLLFSYIETMTSRIILSQLKRTAALRAAILPQFTQHAVKRTMMTKNNLWANRINTHKVSSLLGSQQGESSLV